MMKRLVHWSLAVVLLFGSTALAAQTEQGGAKFGHVNTNELLQMMPGREQAQEELQRYIRDLEDTFAAMQQEFQTKYQEYIENQESYSQLVRQSRERELQSLNERIMEFQESAQQDIMEQEERLLSPIIEKAREAIQRVGREHGYTYIFDTSGGSIVFWENGENIMPLVQQELDLID